MSGDGFSDSEVGQIAHVARWEFGQEGEWTVSRVTRGAGHPDVVNVQIDSTLNQRRLTIPLNYQEFSEENSANGSQLTDAVFNISVRLMEFRHIRGFDEFEDGATVPLDIYPEGRPGLFDDLPRLPPGHRYNLISPFYRDELQPDEAQ
jgi:hypothetical protein